MRSNSQLYRLALEQKILANELPQFSFYDINGDTYVSGWQSTCSHRENYQLKLLLGLHYSDEMPRLYISSPLILPQRNSCRTINNIGVSHFFHTLSNGPDGCVQICHTKPELWNPSMTCVAVLMKGIVWLEAYDAYLQTGRSLNDFLC